MNIPLLFVAFPAALLASQAVGSAQSDSPTAADLAAKLSSAVLDSSSTARLKMDFIPSTGGERTVLQLKVIARRTKAGSEVLYQVLWPKDRKQGSFILRKPAGQAAGGWVLEATDSVKPLQSAQLQDGIFGSDLAYEDLVDNYFSWANQSIVGTEEVNRRLCHILESKPGRGDLSSYGSVRTWVDSKRLVPLKVEKYGPKGQLARRITITLVAKDDADRLIPANFAVERPGHTSQTVLEGSTIKHDVSFSEADFSPDALRSGSANEKKAE